MNTPKKISKNEWQEIIKVKEVQEAWGIEETEKPEDFASMVYGVKFDYMSGGPGYVGHVYILMGDGSPDIPPMILTRQEGRLVVGN